MDFVGAVDDAHGAVSPVHHGQGDVVAHTGTAVDWMARSMTSSTTRGTDTLAAEAYGAAALLPCRGAYASRHASGRRETRA